MGHLTVDELTAAVTMLGEQQGLERVRNRLADMNAFTSRRGLGTPAALAGRLHQLTGGLRREVVATFAFMSLWNELVGGKLGEDGEKKLEALADQVNACLGEHDTIVPGKEEELDRALGAYRDTLAAAVGPDAATLDMLMKAVPAVAARLRTAPAG
jgi:hypothetical protein